MRLLGAIYLLVLVCFLQGCASFTQKIKGNTRTDVTLSQTLTHLFAYDDAEWVCRHLQAITPLFEGAIDSAHKHKNKHNQLLPLLYMTSAMCVELEALKFELDALQAAHGGDSAKALDRRILHARKLAKVGYRYWKGYQSAGAANQTYLELGQCPVFSNQTEALYWMVGLWSGVQAITINTISGAPFEHAESALFEISEQLECIDNLTWWGVPDSLLAFIWLSEPSLAPAGVDAYALLDRAEQVGLDAGVRLASLVKARMQFVAGRESDVKKTITQAANSRKHIPPLIEYRLFDEIAFEYLVLLSDVLWMKDTGSRTPIGKFGTFYKPEPILKHSFEDLL